MSTVFFDKIEKTFLQEVKMQYSQLIQAIKKEIDYEPKQSDFCKILELSRQTGSQMTVNFLMTR